MPWCSNSLVSCSGLCEKLGQGLELKKNYGQSPEELFPNELLGQNKTTPELMKFIDREKERGAHREALGGRSEAGRSG